MLMSAKMSGMSGMSIGSFSAAAFSPSISTGPASFVEAFDFLILLNVRFRAA